jgi:subtilisin family serine protease
VTNSLPSRHAQTGVPLANPALATAALAAEIGMPGGELALILGGTAEQLAALPGHARRGYAVDAASGEIFAPDAALPAGRNFYASARIDLTQEAGGADAVLALLAQLAGNGWSIQPLPKLAPRLDQSLAVIRARPEDLKAAAAGSTRQALPAELDGRGVLVGVVDFGCDFAHPAFLDASGHTRLAFLWDQNAASNSPLPGTLHETDAIQSALAAADPYQALGYWPDRNNYAPAVARGAEIVHGTHVMGVAAGRGVPGCPAGVAPGATLAFVHLRPGALVSSGDPADVFDGVCAVFQRADRLSIPAVVNLSLGANSGSHDGNTLYDCALDALLAKPGRAIAASAGNERQEKLRSGGKVAAGTPVTLRWCFDPGDRTPNTLRIFAPARDAVRALTCDVAIGGTTISRALDDTHNATWLMQGEAATGMLYSGLAPTRDTDPAQHIEIRVRPSGQAEILEVTLSTAATTPVPFDAWIDRDDREQASQSHFDIAPPITHSTLASTACGRRTISVGAFEHRVPNLPAAFFSSEGETRDGRAKPDVSAPGLDVLAAAAYGGRTTPGSPWQNSPAIRMSGTSAAAPHVAGLQALILQVAPASTAEQVSTIIRNTAAPPDGKPGSWDPQLGYGRIDAAAAIAKVLQ